MTEKTEMKVKMDKYAKCRDGFLAMLSKIVGYKVGDSVQCVDKVDGILSASVEYGG